MRILAGFAQIAGRSCSKFSYLQRNSLQNGTGNFSRHFRENLSRNRHIRAHIRVVELAKDRWSFAVKISRTAAVACPSCAALLRAVPALPRDAVGSGSSIAVLWCWSAPLVGSRDGPPHDQWRIHRVTGDRAVPPDPNCKQRSDREGRKALWVPGEIAVAVAGRSLPANRFQPSKWPLIRCRDNPCSIRASGSRT